MTVPPKTPVCLIGRGRIGAGVAEWVARSDAYALRAVIGRGAAPEPAPLTIDAAGPDALRRHGEAVLAQGELWSVGAAALIDDGLRERLEGIARRHGHALRLFTGWIAGPALCAPGAGARLHVTQSAPGLGPAPGPVFSGPLRQAAERFPQHLNSATAAALAGPGIEATTIELISTPDGGAHGICARLDLPGQSIETTIRFGEGPHPVTQAIIAALQARGRWLRYG